MQQRGGQVVLEHRILRALCRRLAEPVERFAGVALLHAQYAKRLLGVVEAGIERDRRSIELFGVLEAALPVQRLGQGEMALRRRALVTVVHDPRCLCCTTL